jgi:hypothetical protein
VVARSRLGVTDGRCLVEAESRLCLARRRDVCECSLQASYYASAIDGIEEKMSMIAEWRLDSDDRDDGPGGCTTAATECVILCKDAGAHSDAHPSRLMHLDVS